MSARSINRASIRNAERDRRRRSRRTRAGIGAAAALGAVAFAAPAAAQGSNFVVTSKLDNGDKVCDATCTIRDAVLSANANPGPDSITFAPGLNGTITLTNGELEIRSAIDVVGPGLEQVRISGDANRNNSADQGDSRIFYVDADVYGDPIDPVTISGLTLREGYADGIGGAIYARNAHLTLDRVLITDNVADSDGGGLYSNYAAVTITDSTFSDNYSDSDGGAMYIDDDDPTTETTSPLVIRNSTIADNYAADDAGGVYADDGTDTVLIDHSTIADNGAGDTAGGLMLFGPRLSRAQVLDTTISGNTSDEEGGGVYVNDAYDVGAEFDNSTIAGNVSNDYGGGIFSDADEAGVILSSTIVADNQAPNEVPNDLSQGFIDPLVGFQLGFSLVETPSDATIIESPAGSNQLGVDPRLGPLTANGGPTRTQLIAPTSPAVDAGTANALPTDQRGLPRIQEQPGANRAGSDGTDIGAVEIPDSALDSPAISARRTQKSKGKRIRIQVDVSAAERVDIEASGSIRAGGKVPLKPVQAVGEAGATTTLSLKPMKKRGAAKVARLLGKGRKARAAIDVNLTDSAGNSAGDRLGVTLKGAPRRKR